MQLDVADGKNKIMEIQRAQENGKVGHVSGEMMTKLLNNSINEVSISNQSGWNQEAAQLHTL